MGGESTFNSKLVIVEAIIGFARQRHTYWCVEQRSTLKTRASIVHTALSQAHVGVATKTTSPWVCGCGTPVERCMLENKVSKRGSAQMHGFSDLLEGIYA